MTNLSKILNSVYLAQQTVATAVLDLFGIFYVKVYSLAFLVINILNWLAVYDINSKVSQDSVVLHYNVDFGVNLIGSAKQIYVIPLLGLVVILINLILAAFIYRQNKFLAHILLGGCIAVNIFLLLGTASVYLVNFYY